MSHQHASGADIKDGDIALAGDGFDRVGARRGIEQ